MHIPYKERALWTATVVRNWGTAQQAISSIIRCLSLTTASISTQWTLENKDDYCENMTGNILSTLSYIMFKGSHIPFDLGWKYSSRLVISPM